MEYLLGLVIVALMIRPILFGGNDHDPSLRKKLLTRKKRFLIASLTISVFIVLLFSGIIIRNNGFNKNIFPYLILLNACGVFLTVTAWEKEWLSLSIGSLFFNIVSIIITLLMAIALIGA